MDNQTEFYSVSSLKEIADLLLQKEFSLNLEARSFLAKAPDGCICCDTRFKRHHYRQRTYVTDPDSGKRECVDKSLNGKPELARLLARKALYKAILRISESNIKGLRKLLPQLSGDTIELAMNSLSPGVRSLLSEKNSRHDWMHDWMRDWMYAPYEKNEAFPEELVISTLSGFSVRSKSEEKIADNLFTVNLAFRYEPKLIIGDEVRYPDFVILHPASTPERMIYIIWEHAGKMGDTEKYVPALCRKLMSYSEAGLVIGENMIYTFEDSKHPLSTAQVIRERNGIISMTKGSPIVERDGHFELAGMPAISQRGRW